MATAKKDSALRHFAKVLIVLVATAAVYTGLLALWFNVRGVWLSPYLAVSGRTLQEALIDGWKLVPYQPLFWLAAAIAFTFYDAVTGELDTALNRPGDASSSEGHAA